MSREYKTCRGVKVYGDAMQDPETHRRPPADRLFCRGDQAQAARPDMADGERAHFAEHFAKEFAGALSETRRERSAD
jgi:hypothetical protein